ncbi:hypothetical protein [Nostoc sp. CHAB 5715]|uniref:hypothetical protein n=1 Tax=Nostoc sp. CHAB 5715 TaxID=2780400 RepID=UPI001E28DE6F|nr:hypothetical protein [Nostoc sp. CHAB 5715]MCC5626415.1 hypothetical protein [Nostoc sp. CHAB 5715]
MPRRIALEPHLSIDELENRYRQSRDAIARTHYQTIWLLAMGKTTAFIGVESGYGCTVLYIPNRVILRRGFCLTCGLTYLILF